MTSVTRAPAADPVILAIETSCDETAAAVLTRDGRIASSVLCSQHDVHERYGGVVPELAARRHIETVDTITADALRKAGLTWTDIEAVAVTSGPGLAGALLVGVSFGKSLAYALRVPLIAVNHLEGHIASAWVDQPDFPVPSIVLIVSGGHTHVYLVRADETLRLLGKTLDDAAGEAFDKVAKLLGLPYPGGPAISRLAERGDPGAVAFPRPMRDQPGFDFSYSGLKTAVALEVERRGVLDEAARADVAASFEAAATDVLVHKARGALAEQGIGRLAVVGGVAANRRLREVLERAARADGFRVVFPPLELCTDNAAMIAAAGAQRLARGERDAADLGAFARAPVGAGFGPAARVS